MSLAAERGDEAPSLSIILLPSLDLSNFLTLASTVSGYPATVCGSQLNFLDEVQSESDGRVCDLVKHDDFRRSIRKSRERR